MTASFTYDSAINGNVSLSYIERVLIPALQIGDMVIMDNLPARKTAGVSYAIQRPGTELMFPPTAGSDAEAQRTHRQSEDRCILLVSLSTPQQETGLQSDHDNTIENAFSKLKAMLRGRANQKIDALWDAVNGY